MKLIESKIRVKLKEMKRQHVYVLDTFKWNRTNTAATLFYREIDDVVFDLYNMVGFTLENEYEKDRVIKD